MNQTASVAVNHIHRFIVVQPRPLAEPSRLEGTGHCFLLPKCTLRELIVRRLMWLVRNVLCRRHGDTDSSCGHYASRDSCSKCENVTCDSFFALAAR